MFGTAPINVGMAERTNFVLWAELGTTSAEIIFVSESAHQRIQDIRKKPSLTPQEQIEQVTKEAATAIASIGLLVWSAKQTKAELANLKAFLESAEKRPPGWIGHADETAAEQREAILHNKAFPPDQALLFGEYRSLRIAAKYAEENTSPKAKPADAIDEVPDGWSPREHWKSLGKYSRLRACVSGALELPSGQFVPGRSDQPTGERRARKQAENGGVDSEAFYSHVRNPELRQALVSIVEGRGKGHGSCAEVFAIDDAIDLVGVQGLNGASWDARIVRNKPNVPDNGVGILACRSCQQLFEKFGIIDTNALRRGREEVNRETVTGFLARLGFPRNWSRANEVMALLKKSGFPVSPAAQEMIRRYGGLNTCGSGGPRSRVLFRIEPSLFSAEEVAYTEHVHGVIDLCPIGYEYEGLGLMCIGSDNTVYFQGGPYFKGATVDEVIEKLLTGERSGGSIAPDEEPYEG